MVKLFQVDVCFWDLIILPHPLEISYKISKNPKIWVCVWVGGGGGGRTCLPVPTWIPQSPRLPTVYNMMVLQHS